MAGTEQPSFQGFDAYRKWLGLRPEDRPYNYYQLLGVPLFESDPDVISNAADQRMAHVRSFQTGPHGALSQKLLNEIAEARVCLLNPGKKAAYDERLRQAMTKRRLAVGTPLEQTAASVPAHGQAPVQPAIVAGAQPAVRRRKGPSGAIWVVAGVAAAGAILLCFLLLPGGSEPTPEPQPGGSEPGGSQLAAGAEPTPEDTRPPAPPDRRPPPPPADDAGEQAPLPPSPDEPGKPGNPARPVPAEGPEQDPLTAEPSPPPRTDFGMATGSQTPVFLDEGRFGKALRPADAGLVASWTVPPVPLTVEFWAKVDLERYHQTLLSNGMARPGTEPGWAPSLWTVYCHEKWGNFHLWFTGYGPPKHVSDTVISDGSWHYLAMTFDGTDLGLYVDGRRALSAQVSKKADPSRPCGSMVFGSTLEGSAPKFVCSGLIDEVRISNVVRPIDAVPGAPFTADANTVGLWHFDEYVPSRGFADASRFGNWAFLPDDNVPPPESGPPLAGTGSVSPPASPALAPPAVPGEGQPGAAPPAVEPSGKLPIPDETEQAEARALVKDVFGEEYKKAEGSPEKLGEFAGVLIAQAAEAKQPPAVYVLLRIALEVSVQAGDAARAMQAVDRMEVTFEVDGAALRVAALDSMAKRARGDENRVLAAQIVPLLDDLVLAGRAREAQRLGGLAVSAARRTRDADFVKRIVDRVKEADDLADLYVNEVKPALTVLAEQPDDPAANRTVGQFRCLVQRDWGAGLPMLARGDDPALKAVAAKELEEPTSPEAQAALGDAWWDLAETKTGRQRDSCLLRAGHWYERAGPQLSSMLEKLKVRKRMEEVAALRASGGQVATAGPSPEGQPAPAATDDTPPTRPQPRAKDPFARLNLKPQPWILLPPLVEADRDTKDASWKWDGEVASFAAGKRWAAVSFPLAVQGSYELQTRVTITRAKETTAIMLPVLRNRAITLHMRGDRGNSESPTATIYLGGLQPRPQALGDVSMNIGTEYGISCKVVGIGNGVAVEVRRDDQVIYQWAGPVSQIGQGRVMRPGAVELGTSFYTSSQFKELRFRMLSGKATKLFPEETDR